MGYTAAENGISNGPGEQEVEGAYDLVCPGVSAVVAKSLEVAKLEFDFRLVSVGEATLTRLGWRYQRAGLPLMGANGTGTWNLRTRQTAALNFSLHLAL